MNRPSVALLLSVCSLAILSLASTAQAVTLTNHVVIPHGVTHEAEEHVVAVTTVAPRDSDDDGVADQDDACPNEPYSGNGGCEPEPIATSYTGDVASAQAETIVPTSTAGTPPEYIKQCESGGDYGAVNPSSGAAGAWQILPSTSASYGCDMSSPAGQDACAAEIYSDVGSSAWVCAG